MWRAMARSKASSCLVGALFVSNMYEYCSAAPGVASEPDVDMVEDGCLRAGISDRHQAQADGLKGSCRIVAVEETGGGK